MTSPLATPERALILGAGYLGLRLGERLRGGGTHTLATTASGASDPAIRTAGLTPLRWCSTEPTAARDLETASRDMDWIFFTAAPSGVGNHEAVYDRSAEHLARVLPPLAPRAVVFVSSTSVYGVSDGSWVDETTPTDPIRERGRILLGAEKRLLATVSDGLPVRIVRASGIYGPGRLPWDRLRGGNELPGTGAEMINLIHVDDLVEILMTVAARGRNGGVYLATDGEPVSRREYYTEAAALVGLPAPRFGGEDSGLRVRGQGKRLRSRLLVDELGVSLRYPGYRTGLLAGFPPP